MSLEIRKLIDQDLPEVFDLFRGRKTKEELKWLFQNPDNLKEYNAFVAQNKENKIVGVIGFMILKFHINQKTIKGVIPYSWMIDPDHRGFAGILLLKKVLEQGEFGYAIRGSKMAQDVFIKFKYVKVTERYLYKKSLKPLKALAAYKRKSILKKISRFIKILPNYLLSLRKLEIYNDVSLTPYNNNDIDELGSSASVLQVKINKNAIKWFSDCPILNTYVFNINHNNKNIGLCIYYIRKSGDSISGRIVYMSFLGNDKQLWYTVLSKTVGFFKSQKCKSIETVGLNEIQVNSLKRLGFYPMQSSQPIFIRDPKNHLLNINFSNMYSQYIEGDKAYRGLN